MFDKIKKFVTDHKAAVIKAGATVIGAIVGAMIIAVVNRPVDDLEEIEGFSSDESGANE